MTRQLTLFDDPTLNPTCKVCGHPASSHRLIKSDIICRQCPDNKCQNWQDGEAPADEVKEYKVGDQVTIGGTVFTKISEDPFGEDTNEQQGL